MDTPPPTAASAHPDALAPDTPGAAAQRAVPDSADAREFGDAPGPTDVPAEGAVYVGKADLDAPGEQGWLLGHFRPAGDPRHSTDVEIKWGRHPKGDRRARWVTGEERTALLILISGRFHVELPDRTVVLTDPGDYIVWGRGVDHSWQAEEESVVLTVRWPSIPGYKVPPQR